MLKIRSDKFSRLHPNRAPPISTTLKPTPEPCPQTSNRNLQQQHRERQPPTSRFSSRHGTFRKYAKFLKTRKICPLKPAFITNYFKVSRNIIIIKAHLSKMGDFFSRNNSNINWPRTLIGLSNLLPLEVGLEFFVGCPRPNRGTTAHQIQQTRTSNTIGSRNGKCFCR